MRPASARMRAREQEGLAMSTTYLHSEEADYLALIGRQLFAMIFMIASAGHFTPAQIALAAEHGVPLATILVPISGVIALIGGVSAFFRFPPPLRRCPAVPVPLPSSFLLPHS